VIKVTPYLLHLRLYWSIPLNVSQGGSKDTITLKLHKKYFALKDIWGIHKDWKEPEDVLKDEPLGPEASNRRLRKS
jgi:hypothetical protein